MHKWERLQSTACECGDRRAWKNGPCVNAACRHYRTKLTAKEAAISLAIAVLLLAFAAWAILVPIF